jgi:uncharacterized protein YxjI
MLNNNREKMKASEANINPNVDVQYRDNESSPSDIKTMDQLQYEKTSPPSTASNLWHHQFYRIRKKSLTIGNKYWIEDQQGTILGFCKQKILRFKEDVRIYSDEQMTYELFHIKQEQIMDTWGRFAVIDSATNTKVGCIKRNWVSNFGRDQWEVYDINDQLIGKFYESSLGRGLARKYVPYLGLLIPEKMTLELNGQPVAEINQKFKIIGDIWEMECRQIPATVDRRVLLACILLMGTIERSRKNN